MENDWHCPLPHCRKSVANFGGSTEVTKTNPIYGALSKSLYAIERIMSTAADNWWSSLSCDATAAGGKIDNTEEKKREHDSSSSMAAATAEVASRATAVMASNQPRSYHLHYIHAQIL